ncbi:MAG TPA: hypothetical protein VIZ00_05375 [Streptosporangiaceae bacterium]
MPFAAIPQAEPVTRRDKRIIAVIGAVIVAVLAGVGIWAAAAPGSYGASSNGCITVNLPSTMGGSLVHACGGRAASLCADAYAGTGLAPRLFRPQCRLAGIAAPSGAGATAP